MMITWIANNLIDKLIGKNRWVANTKAALLCVQTYIKISTLVVVSLFSLGGIGVMLALVPTKAYTQENDNEDTAIETEQNILTEQDILYFSLDDALEQSLLNNLTLKREERSLNSLRSSANTSFNRFYPTANASTTLSALNEEPANPAFPRNSLSASINIQLNISLAQIASIEQAALNYQSGRVSYDKARQELIATTYKAFYNLILLQENIAIVKESLRLAEERVAQTQVRFNAGLIDEYTLLSSQVTAENSRPLLAELEAIYDSARRRFNLAIGVPIEAPADNVKLVGDIDPQIYSLDRLRLIQDLIYLNLDLRNLVISEQITRNALTTHIAQFIPSLSFGYNVNPSFQNEIFESPDLFNGDNWSIGGGFNATLSIPLSPLIPFSQTWNNISTTQRQLESIQSTQIETRDNLIIEAQSQIDTLEKIEAILVARELSVQLAEKALQVADEGYKVGLREILEVRDAQNQLDNARFNYLNERYNYIAAQVDLALLLGMEIDDLAQYQKTE